MGSASSITKSFIVSVPSGIINKVASKIHNAAPTWSVSQKLTAKSLLHHQKQLCEQSISDIEANTVDKNLLAIRDLLDKDNAGRGSFVKLVELRGKKVFVEKYDKMEEMQKKIFHRRMMDEFENDDYHQLDDIICSKDLLTIDCATTPAIHSVFEKLYKFIYNYQTSYERWMEILGVLEDELLAQLVIDYNELIEDPKKKHIVATKSSDNMSAKSEGLTRVPSFGSRVQMWEEHHLCML